MRNGYLNVVGVILGVFLIGLSGRLFDADACSAHPDIVKTSPALAAGAEVYNEYLAAFAERGINRKGPGLAAGAQLSGNFNMLVVCVEFSDHASSVPASDFDDLVFASSGTSVRTYYEEVSYGTFHIVAVDLPSTIGWQTAPQTYAYYVNGAYGFGSYPNNTQKLVEDLIALIDPVVDFSDYDNDLNGYMDGLIVVHTGTGAELSGDVDDIWSHKWGISPDLRDGVWVSDFSIQPEYWLSPGDITIGVYCHEIGHVFGLPDLYDIDGSSRGIGRWSLMANGSWNGSLGASPAHFDAWCRKELGFVTPTVVSGGMSQVDIPAVENSPTIFRLWEEGAGGDEYFLIENRQKTGFDAALPSSGLLIWHCDDTRTNNTKEWYPGHTSNGNFWVALEQADGLWEMEKNIDYGDSGDPYPGSTNQTFFSAATTPSSDAYSGSQTFVTITDISPSADTMTADFAVSLETGVRDGWDWTTAVPDQNIINHPNPFNPTTRISYTLDRPGQVNLDIYDVLGRHVRSIVSTNSEAGAFSAEWDGQDDHGRSVASGVYFARLTTGYSQSSHKMVLVR